MELEAAATISVCLAVGVLAVTTSDVVARWLPLPAVVLEILGGILVGPAVLGIAHDNEIVSAFSELGLTVHWQDANGSRRPSTRRPRSR